MFDGFWGGAFGNALSPNDIAAIRSLYAPRFPTFSAHVWGRHAWRSDLIIKLGVKDSPAGSVLWQTDVQLRAGGGQADFDYDEIDLTAALPYLNGVNDWFVTLSDVSGGVSGDLDGFTMRYGTPGNWQTLGVGNTGAIPDSGAGTLTSWISNPVAPVPEPATVALMGLGLIWFSWARLRRTRRHMTLARVPAAHNLPRVV